MTDPNRRHKLAFRIAELAGDIFATTPMNLFIPRNREFANLLAEWKDPPRPLKRRPLKSGSKSARK